MLASRGSTAGREPLTWATAPHELSVSACAGVAAAQQPGCRG